MILITGATGFVGSWLTATSGEREVRAVGRDLDLSGEWTHVIHCAPAGNQTVLEAARQQGARTVFISSGAARAPNDA